MMEMALIVAFVIIVIVLVYYKVRKNAPEFSAHVKILNKTSKVMGRFTNTFYYISFELSDGTVLTLDTSAEVYKLIPEGATGEITYTKYEVRGFEKNRA